MNRLLLAGMFVLASAGSASAQVWDSPSFFSPRPGSDIGIYFIEPNDGDWGLQGIWRQTGNINLGIRGGVVDAPGGSQGVVGLELFNPVGTGSNFPLDVSWIVGVGASFGDNALVTVPLGLSFGAVLNAGALTLIPYVHPRLSLDFFTNDDDSEFELEFPVDLGADVRVNNVIIRVGGTLSGDHHEAVGVGLAFPFGRRVEVR